jgi:hypothetical protein
MKPPSSAAQDAIEEELNAATVVRQACPALDNPESELPSESDVTIMRDPSQSKGSNASLDSGMPIGRFAQKFLRQACLNFFTSIVKFPRRHNQLLRQLWVSRLLKALPQLENPSVLTQQRLLPTFQEAETVAR